ncbi:MAG: FtsW/RodA/SpoVE family cell cycle protein [Bryobacteraceae bacterium]|nr:FtsW/RodA/SpoVE family cell cycle protein [Bryobacteraceae bacterium]
MAQRLKTDWILLSTVVAMVSLGLVVMFSASSLIGQVKFQSSTYFLMRQLGWAVIGLAALMYFKKRDFRTMQTPAWAFASLGVVLALLVAVYFLDQRAHRWIRFAGFSLQPSELAKPALAIFLAYFISLRARAINSRHTLLPAALAVVMLTFMVVVADLGTAIVLLLTAVIVFFVAGLEPRYFALAAAAALLFGGIAVISKPYRLGRVLAYVDPEHHLLSKVDPEGRLKKYLRKASSVRDPGYQARQSKIAVGTGGVIGVGLMQGKQKLLYLPEAHTDFIYAVVGEELGLLGSAALLAGFLVILWRGMRLFWTVPDEFGRYLALGITTVVVVQALINMSVVLDLAPTKGIPLPMISSGGSSLLSTLMSLGMLLSISEHAG